MNVGEGVMLAFNHSEKQISLLINIIKLSYKSNMKNMYAMLALLYCDSKTLST